jgi:hypothetical protein
LSADKLWLDVAVVNDVAIWTNEPKTTGRKQFKLTLKNVRGVGFVAAKNRHPVSAARTKLLHSELRSDFTFFMASPRGFARDVGNPARFYMREERANNMP